jgi:hypothetical protein
MARGQGDRGVAAQDGEAGPHRGHGLSLAIVYAIAGAHGATAHRMGPA